MSSFTKIASQISWKKFNYQSMLQSKSSTECVNCSVSGFGETLLRMFPRPLGHSTAAGRQEENCKKNIRKKVITNPETELMTHSVSLLVAVIRGLPFMTSALMGVPS